MSFGAKRPLFRQYVERCNGDGAAELLDCGSLLLAAQDLRMAKNGSAEMTVLNKIELATALQEVVDTWVPSVNTRKMRWDDAVLEVINAALAEPDVS